MDVFFSRPRMREHLPNIPGLNRLAKAEVLDDLDTIRAASRNAPPPATTALATAVAPAIAAGTAQVALAAEVIPAVTSGVPQAIATTAVANNALARASRRKDVYGNGTALRAAGMSSTADGSKRQRLEFRVMSERRLLDEDYRTPLTQLRGELEMLRTSMAQYEEAIASSRREIELAKREKQELEEQFNALKGEYELSVATTETARADEEKAESELRERLSQATQIAADAQARVDQLQLIETEFKTKELTIAHLREDITRLDQTVQQLRGALANKTFNASLIQTSPSPTPQQQAGQTIKTSASSPASPNQHQHPSASPTATSSSPTTQHQHQPSPTNILNNNQTQLHSVKDAMATAGLNINTNNNGIIAAAKSNSAGVIMVTGDLVRYILTNTEKLATAHKTIKTLQTERDHLAIQVQEREQLLHTQYAQIERITKFNADLQSTVKVSSALLHDERLKHEQTLKQMHLVMQQRKDANDLIQQFEQKIFAFDSVLAISDNRATEAEMAQHDTLQEVRTMRSALKTMQGSYNQLLQRHTYLQQYHQNLANLILDATPDLTQEEITALSDHHLLHSAAAAINGTPNVDKATFATQFPAPHNNHTSAQTPPNASANNSHRTSARKHAAPRHNGVDLGTYNQLVDYKRLFQRLHDVLLRTVSRRDVDLLTPNTAQQPVSLAANQSQPNSSTSSSAHGSTDHSAAGTHHLAEPSALDLNADNGNGMLTDANGNELDDTTMSGIKVKAPVINQTEVNELQHISMP